MIIRKIDNIYIVKIFNKPNFDYFNQDDIKELFQNIIKKIKKKYNINGLLDINVYVNYQNEIFIEIEEIKSYFNEIDMHIHFHLDTIFLQEINEIDSTLKSIYYYKNKFYTTYNKKIDSPIIYKTEDILKESIKVV